MLKADYIHCNLLDLLQALQGFGLQNSAIGPTENFGVRGAGRTYEGVAVSEPTENPDLAWSA